MDATVVMGHRVRIFLREPAQQTGKYIGETIFPSAPKPAAEVCFEHQGCSLRGVIEQIVPADWDPNSELIPALHIVAIIDGPTGRLGERDHGRT